MRDPLKAGVHIDDLVRHPPWSARERDGIPPVTAEFGKPEWDERGCPVTFPHYCEHCGVTRWVKPADKIADLPEACLAEMARSGHKNLGTGWWTSFERYLADIALERIRKVLAE